MGNRPVWLVGMMGAGKSAVGPRLAERLGRGFADTDAEVERSAGATIAEIFAREGEGGFRERERAAIEALAACSDVVALGGGAIAQVGAPERLATSGTVVYLRAAPETLLARLGSCATRPLLHGLSRAGRLARLTELLAERAASYETAAIVVDTDELDADEVADAVLARLLGAEPVAVVAGERS